MVEFRSSISRGDSIRPASVKLVALRCRVLAAIDEGVSYGLLKNGEEVRDVSPLVVVEPFASEGLPAGESLGDLPIQFGEAPESFGGCVAESPTAGPSCVADLLLLLISFCHLLVLVLLVFASSTPELEAEARRGCAITPGV